MHLHHAADPGPRGESLHGEEALVSPHTTSNKLPRSAPEPDPKFLSRRDVAQLFGVSLSTVTRWARTGLLRTVRTPGGHYRYRVEDIRRAARSSG